MGFFSGGSDTSSSSIDLAPLTTHRVTQSLDRLEWNFQVDDDDGSIVTGWEYGVFAFFLNGNAGEILVVRGYWRGELNEADYSRALETCNDWNVSAIWPKACVTRDDEGLVRVSAEHNVDYEHGLSDAQLDQHLLCAVNSGMVFFEKIIETFPEAWAQATSAG